MLETERADKKKALRELQSRSKELDDIRTEASRAASENADSSSPSDEDDEEPKPATTAAAKTAETQHLLTLLTHHSQIAKSLKTELSHLRRSTNAKILALQTTLDTLRAENASLKVALESQRAETEAVNRAVDERLAASLTKMLRERETKVVGKRDDQWVERVKGLEGERRLLGKVVMREWGKGECGGGGTGGGEGEGGQLYRYQFVKRG